MRRNVDDEFSNNNSGSLFRAPATTPDPPMIADRPVTFEDMGLKKGTVTFESSTRKLPPIAANRNNLGSSIHIVSSKHCFFHIDYFLRWLIDCTRMAPSGYCKKPINFWRKQLIFINFQVFKCKSRAFYPLYSLRKTQGARHNFTSHFYVYGYIQGGYIWSFTVVILDSNVMFYALF